MSTHGKHVFTPRQSTLDWLLEETNPPVRYLALVNLLGRSRRDSDVTAAREAVQEYPPVKQSLHSLLSVGTIEPVDLSVLAIVGLSRQVRQVDEICRRVLDGQIRHQSGYGCYIGHILGSLMRLGYLGDPRLEPYVKVIMQGQRFLDGNRPGTELRYGRLSSVCAGSHSCFSAVAWSLWALLAIPAARRTPEIKEFLQRGAGFLRTHRLYKSNHGGFKPVRPEWLKLQLPLGLGWRTDVLHILEVAGQIGLANDPASADAVAFVLSRQDSHGRWLLDVRNPDRTAGCTPLWMEDTVGQPSKWVTLAALTQLTRFNKLVHAVPCSCRGLQEHAPTNSSGSMAPNVCLSESTPPHEQDFAPYPFKREPAREQKVRDRWADADMQAALDALLDFTRGARLCTGWHDGLVIGPKWCREWCSAVVSWVPRPRFDKAWPVCHLYFLAARRQFAMDELSSRLDIPAEDEQDKARLPRLYRNAFWRIKISPWRENYDEVALTLRNVDELNRAMPLMLEALRKLGTTHRSQSR